MAFWQVLKNNGFHVAPGYVWEKRIEVDNKGSFILIASEAFDKMQVTIEATVADSTFDIDEFFEYVDFFLAPIGWYRKQIIYENSYEYSNDLFSTDQELDTTLKQTIPILEQLKNDLFDNSIEEI